jgi:Notch-like protein
LKDDLSSTSISALIGDAAHMEVYEGFYFLPPMVRQPTVSGTFDATLAPTVEVCEWLEDSCARRIALYPMNSGPGLETVRVQPLEERYEVQFHARDFGLEPAFPYRVNVTVGEVLLGFADISVLSSGSEIRNIDTGSSIPLLNKRTLPITFRIERTCLPRCVHGLCTEQAAGFACACDAGWQGEACDQSVDSCADAPCQNGGSCTDVAGGYTCECAAGYEGDDCETDIDECGGDPCKNGGGCVDGVARSNCLGGAGYW